MKAGFKKVLPDPFSILLLEIRKLLGKEDFLAEQQTGCASSLNYKFSSGTNLFFFGGGAYCSGERT